jgi:hypothetical protein
MIQFKIKIYRMIRVHPVFSRHKHSLGGLRHITGLGGCPNRKEENTMQVPGIISVYSYLVRMNTFLGRPRGEARLSGAHRSRTNRPASREVISTSDFLATHSAEPTPSSSSLSPCLHTYIHTYRQKQPTYSGPLSARVEIKV